jgi:hypothetical protein
MLQITPQMRILVAVAPVDFRKGIDGLAALCKETLKQDPFKGTVFIFRNRRATAIKVLVYDGQGFWLCQKRLSEKRFRWWPSSKEDTSVEGVPVKSIAAHEVAVLFSAGNPNRTGAAPAWRSVTPER